MSRNQLDYDDPDYVQTSQLCEICGDRWYGSAPLKRWSKHPNVIVHVECDIPNVKKRARKPTALERYKKMKKI